MITKRKKLLASSNNIIRLSLRRTLQLSILLSAVEVLLQKLKIRYSWTSLTFGEGKRVRLLVTISSFALIGFTQLATAQLMAKKETFTHADTLRGSLNPNRDWWDVLYYRITVKPDFAKKMIEGEVMLLFKVIKDGNTMQIDLQAPLIVDSIDAVYNEKHYRIEKISFKQENNTVILSAPYAFKKGTEDMIFIKYHGKPKEAIRPPWDGGWIWRKDAKGNPWMSVACQGLGASAWYPCKDYQGDEPDYGASLTMIVPDTLVAVANGRLVKSEKSIVNSERSIINKSNTSFTTHNSPFTSYTWEVKNPINNYLIIPSIGKYVNFTDTLMGEKGKLDLSYWVLDYNLEKAKEQFKQAKLMLCAFEYWFGPYPFYEDSYKLVESPHLGMEHQSATAYGNKFGNGYLGRDLSGSGWGLKWDYIIVHESGHEWFANNITTKDIADMWVHEGFTDYSETLFTEYYYGKEAGNDYNYGQRSGIQNEHTIIGPYGVNKEGSGDMYPKGANLIHTIRHSINNDSLFRQILRGLNKDFYHKTVTTNQVENYISNKAGINFQKTFDQYLRDIKIPQLNYVVDATKSTVTASWANCIDGFDMPITIIPTNKHLKITTKPQSFTLTNAELAWFTKSNIERQFYITTKQLTFQP
jgi:aminopeptidase N